jgi:hypothetical protein
MSPEVNEREKNKLEERMMCLMKKERKMKL